MKNELFLRDVLSDDLPIFFEQQLNEEANCMNRYSLTQIPTDCKVIRELSKLK